MFYILGNGGFANEVYDLILKIYDTTDVTFITLENETTLLNPAHISRPIRLFLGVGDCAKRKELMEKFSDPTKYEWPNLIHPSSSIGSNVKLSQGITICHNCYIGPHAKIGEGCLLNNNSQLGHDSTLGKFSILSPGALVSGRCSIGEGCYIGCGSAIRERLTVGDGALVGMGSTVIRNVKSYTKVFGSPAKAFASIPRA